MSEKGPWEEYQSAPAEAEESGPWTEYQASSEGEGTPVEAEKPGLLSKVGDALAIEKQPGLPRSPVELLKQAARQTVEGFKSPVPGSVLGLPARMLQEQAGQIGAEVARGFSTPGGLLPDIGTVPARLAGLGAAALTDPTTFTGAVGGYNAGAGVTKKVLQETSLMKVLADVPEEAVTVLNKTRDLFKKATGSDKAIEQAVKNVQNALGTTLKREGTEIGRVEARLGIARTPEALRQEILAGRGTGAYMAQLQGMKATDLLTEYERMKPALVRVSPGEKIATLNVLKSEMNGRISNFQMAGDPLEGLLKSTAKEISGEIKRTPGGEALRNVQAKYARARNLYDSLKKLLKDDGQAEQMLENVFKSQAPRYKTIRKGLAELEKLSGEPVFTQLFQEFAVKSLNKWVGRPNVLRAAGAAAAYGAGSLNLGVLGAAGVAAASQSPVLLSRAIPSTVGVLGGLFGASTPRLNQSTPELPLPPK